MQLPATSERVTVNTSPRVNDMIQSRMEQGLLQYVDRPEEISERLRELDEEWDIERAIEANAATLSLAGLALGIGVRRGFLFLPAVVAGFLLQHALQGWCPPVPLFRRLGFRTQYEIDQERYALKALRGDFDGIGRKIPGGRLELRERTLDAVYKH